MINAIYSCLKIWLDTKMLCWREINPPAHAGTRRRLNLGTYTPRYVPAIPAPSPPHTHTDKGVRYYTRIKSDANHFPSFHRIKKLPYISLTEPPLPPQTVYLAATLLRRTLSNVTRSRTRESIVQYRII